MTPHDKYIAFLKERIETASSIETESAYRVCLSAFAKIVTYETTEEVHLETKKE